MLVSAASQQDRKIAGVVRVGITQVTAEEHYRVVEHRCRSFTCGFHRAQEITKTSHKCLLDVLELSDIGFVPSVISTDAGGTGKHRLQLTWDAVAQTATFAIDQDYADGEFVADHTFATLDGSDSLFDESNSHIFFGGFGNVQFDDLSITGESVVPDLDLVRAELLGSDEFAQSQTDGTLEGAIDAWYEDLVGQSPTEE